MKRRRFIQGNSYSKETLEEALNNIRRGALTVYRAAKEYGIPKITLYSRLKGKRGVKSQTLGRSTAIPPEHETKLASCLKVMEKWGFGLSRKEIIEIVAIYVAKNGLVTPFRNGIPGEDWFLGFKQRHNLSVKKPQNVEYARKRMTDPFVVNAYFDLLLSCLNDLELHSKPENVWNLDETSICVDPSKTKVVGEKMCPQVEPQVDQERRTLQYWLPATLLEEKPHLLSYLKESMYGINGLILMDIQELYMQPVKMAG